LNWFCINLLHLDMLTITTTSGIEDLQQILELQERNLIRNLSDTEMKTEGFVTIHHSLHMLTKMHSLGSSIIVRDETRVVAYALTMMRQFSNLVPGLQSMFERFELLQWRQKPVNDYRYYVMGQICIDKAYRGQGLFDLLYQKHRSVYGSDFDFIVTEIATRNHRSMRAHERVGFKIINTYTDELDEWNVVVWDWNA
jgi:hypothetical protein